MILDRSAILRGAARLRQQGALSQALEEYLRLLDHEPRDWETARLASGLHMQLGQTDRALQQLMRIADGLREEGRLAEAAQAYEDILAVDASRGPAAGAETASHSAAANRERAAGDSSALDDVFAQFRREASDAMAEEQSEAELLSGEALLAAGRIDEGLDTLRRAARAPRLRFRAAALAARAYRDRGDRQAAVDWFERAAEAPPPDRASAHALLYELADALESMGEDARALAIFLELWTDAGAHKDVQSRIKQLRTRGTRG